jgi:Fic family protein
MILEKLITEKNAGMPGGLYHATQIKFAYNSNKIEGSKLSEEQTRYIFETNTIGFRENPAIPVDDIIEFENIIEYHHKFETIHPFQDGNGRVGRLVTFRECLKNNIILDFHEIIES